MKNGSFLRIGFKFDRGCDIVREMFESGELGDVFKGKGIETRG